MVCSRLEMEVGEESELEIEKLTYSTSFRTKIPGKRDIELLFRHDPSKPHEDGMVMTGPSTYRNPDSSVDRLPKDLYWALREVGSDPSLDSDSRARIDPILKRYSKHKPDDSYDPEKGQLSLLPDKEDEELRKIFPQLDWDE